MFRSSLLAIGFVQLLVMVSLGSPAVWGQVSSGALTLQPADTVFVVPQLSSGRTRFVNYIFWSEMPDSKGALIQEPDTSAWNPSTSTTPQNLLSVPTSGGAYSGSIDRQIDFFVLNSGTVGQSSFRADSAITVRFKIIAEEEWASSINIGAGYSPGDPIPCIFINQNTQETLDLGLNIQFSSGLADSNGSFTVCLQDFEGFHIWRGIRKDGSDLAVIGELSKEEAFLGGIVDAQLDSLYFGVILDSLRSSGVFRLPAAVPGLGNQIDIRDIHPNKKLGPNEFVWFDFNVFNGFTYYYTITTFDRGFNCNAHRQGLIKFDHCKVDQGEIYPCQCELVTIEGNACDSKGPPLENEITPQNDMKLIYAVPNPFRDGSSQFSTPNYHNFPDQTIRFVNLPARYELAIYTPAGDLVWWWNDEIAPSTMRRSKTRIGDVAGGGGNVAWDVKNAGGHRVASGIYIYRVKNKDSGEAMFGRLVVIR